MFTRIITLIMKEWRVLLRDPHGLTLLFVMPAIFIIVMSLALRDMYSSTPKPFPYAIVDQDQSPTSTEFVDSWRALHPEEKPLPDNWQRELQDGQLRYVITILPGMGQKLLDSEKPLVRILTDPLLDITRFRTLEAQSKAEMQTLRAKAYLAQLKKRHPQLSLPEITLSQASGVDIAQLGERAYLSSTQQNVPAWLIFGMFFVLNSMANLLIQERQNGTLSRLAVLGVPSSMILLSKAAAYIVINAMQAALMLIIGVWFMPHIGGVGLSLASVNWLALIFVLLSTSIAAIGLSLLISCLVRTHAQASAVGPFVNVLLAAFGGIMVPTFVMPNFMQKVALFSPMNWALEGLIGVLVRGQGLAQISWAALSLCALGAACTVISIVLYPKSGR